MTNVCALPPAEQEQVRAWSLAGIGPAEIARRLGRKRTEIERTWRNLIARGEIPRRARSARRLWDIPREIDQLATLIESGYSYDQIARKLRRSRRAVILAAKRWRLGRITTTDATISAQEAGQWIGVDGKVIVGWIRRKWLKARNAGDYGRSLWRINPFDLYDFLEREDHWMAWHPALIPDADLRAWATEVRAGKPAWLSVGEVARRYHVSIKTVAQWISRGKVPATRYGNYWIRESDLAGFVIPCERPRAKRRAA